MRTIEPDFRIAPGGKTPLLLELEAVNWPGGSREKMLHFT
jgi:hypothetical protein